MTAAAAMRLPIIATQPRFSRGRRNDPGYEAAALEERGDQGLFRPLLDILRLLDRGDA
jgi:hypothetical protein